MFLSYGNVDMKIVRFLLCERVAQYDSTGIDYLYTKWRISVEAIYTQTTGTNLPYTISTSQTNPAAVVTGPNLVFGPASFTAVQTDVSLRHALMQPRQKLTLAYGSASGGTAFDVWLISPSLPALFGVTTTDMNNGPTPIECTVEEVRGEGGLFLIRYTIETCVNECNGSGGTTPLILSNRYTVSTSTDDNFYETRTFTGEAVFRADLVNYGIGGRTDISLFRPNILPPMPQGCKRYIDQLAIMPDGITIKYTIRDVEQEVPYVDQPTFANGAPNSGFKRNVTSIDATVYRSYEQVGANSAATTIVNELRNSMFSVGSLSNIYGQSVGEGGKALGDAANAVGAGSGTLIAAEIALLSATAGLNAGNAVLPVFKETVICEVRGNRYAKKADLQMLAFSVAFGQLTDINKNSINTGLNPGLSSLPNLIGASGILPSVTNAAGLNIPIVGQMVKGAFKNAQNSVNSAIGTFTSILKLIPTAHVIKLEYDVFKKRVKVEVQQEVSGLVDFIAGRTTSGRAALYAPLQDVVWGGQWPAFFTPGGAVVDTVFGRNTTINNPIFPFPPPLADADNLIGTASPLTPGIGPGFDNAYFTGSFLDLLVADLGTPCSNSIQPMSAVNELRGSPLSPFSTDAPQQPTTANSP